MGKPTRTHPTSVIFNVKNEELTPHTLVKLLFTANKIKGWELPRGFETYIAQARQLLTEIEPDKICELLTLAVEVSYHPFGIEFLRSIYESRNKYTNE